MVVPKNQKDKTGVLVTGAGGYVGSLLVQALAAQENPPSPLVAADVREPATRLAGVDYLTLDVRDAQAVAQAIGGKNIRSVVHLAAIVTPKGDSDPQLEYDVDVKGTENVLRACVKAGVAQVITTSSGAAYGYHADNAALLTEDCPIRGNDEFPYSRHKRLVEEMLADYRKKHPALGQLIFRPGTILGKSVKNQITQLFEGPVVLGLADAATPFVFICDEDVVNCLLKGVRTGATGIYNLAGDGVMTMKEIAGRMGKPFIGVPSKLMEEGLGFLKPRGLVAYGPEQVRFLKYRPVLGNEKLKREFGYVPKRTSREVFDLYWQHQPREGLAGFLRTVNETIKGG